MLSDVFQLARKINDVTDVATILPKEGNSDFKGKALNQGFAARYP